MNFINQLLENLKKEKFIRDNIWGANLADMQLLSKFKKKDLDSYVLLTFIVNMLGLFL